LNESLASKSRIDCFSIFIEVLFSKVHDNGKCILGKCHCNTHYTGLWCDKLRCINNCSRNGECMSDFKCKCNPGYSGDDCSEGLCENNCSVKIKINLRRITVNVLFLVVFVIMVLKVKIVHLNNVLRIVITTGNVILTLENANVMMVIMDIHNKLILSLKSMI
jgi:hypothetical protein